MPKVPEEAWKGRLKDLRRDILPCGEFSDEKVRGLTHFWSPMGEGGEDGGHGPRNVVNGAGTVFVQLVIDPETFIFITTGMDMGTVGEPPGIYPQNTLDPPPTPRFDEWTKARAPAHHGEDGPKKDKPIE